MICSKCGNEMPGAAKFCPECGAASSQSGTEADLSLGGLRTMAAEPAPVNSPQPDRSLNSLPTIDTRNPNTQHPTPNTQPPIPNTETTPLSSRYELLEEIGHGGFAVVWKARDRKLGRIVAVKRLLVEALQGSAGEQTLARFRRESQAIAQLTHRNIVAVYDHDRDAEGDYIVMEYVAGGTLRQHLQAQGGKLPVPEALALIRGIAQGLAYAHRKNLVHRDIKPANILLHREGEETVPKIVDFGLARAGSDSEISQSGYGMGTPWYMPPEQRRDAKGVNHTADIYALGKVLYELVSGETPDNVDPEKVPAALAKIIHKCCKSNPEERYFSCEELLAALDESGIGYSGRVTQGSRPLSPNTEHQIPNTENACPACGAANVADVKFCESCGAGLTRLCPECGRENSVHKQYCGGCGTDVEGFGKTQEALARMERFRDEKRWSRVLKEGGLLEETPSRLPGKKGQALLAQVSKLKEQAVAAQTKCARLKQVIDESLVGGDFAAASAAAAGYLETDPHDATLAALAEKIGQAEVLVQKATVAADAGDPPVARAALADLSAIAETKAGAERVAQSIEDRLVQYEQARGLAAQAIREKRVGTALAALDQALAAAPKSAEVMDARRECQEMLRRVREAVQSAEALLHTDNAAALAACREALAITPDDARAGELEQRIAKAVSDAAGLRGRAAEALEARRPDTALALWAEAARLDASGGDADVGRKITDAAETVRSELKQAREALARAAVVRAETHARLALARQEECSEAQAVLNACGSIRRRRKHIAMVAVCVVAIGTAVIIRQRCAVMRRTLEWTLSAANAAKTDGHWGDCLVKAEAVLGLAAGHTEALALKKEAEEKLAPMLNNAQGMAFVLVGPGSFEMGSNYGYSDERPVHRVIISHSFWMGKTEVTQALWRQVMGDTPSHFKGDDLPVELVSWDRCVDFCMKLTLHERAAGRLPSGYEYRLPTESEWEYAARGGTKSRRYTSAGGNDIDSVAWYDGNSEKKTHPVGLKNPNELGLYDMNGNVWEWCSDWYGTYPLGSVTDPQGATDGLYRVNRGGSWHIAAAICRSANRYWCGPALEYNYLGFRVVLAPVP